MKKSQVSIEILISVSLILILFLFVTLIGFYKNKDIENASLYLERRDNCLMVSDFINGVFNNDGSEIIVEIKYDLIINDLIVDKETNITCNYVGNVVYVDVDKGLISIKNVNKEVIIQNV